MLKWHVVVNSGFKCTFRHCYVNFHRRNYTAEQKSELIAKCRHENKYYTANHAQAVSLRSPSLKTPEPFRLTLVWWSSSDRLVRETAAIVIFIHFNKVLSCSTLVLYWALWRSSDYHFVCLYILKHPLSPAQLFLYLLVYIKYIYIHSTKQFEVIITIYVIQNH